MAMQWRDPVDRTIVVLAIPALGTLAVEPLYVAVDTAIVGHLGTVPLGGLAVASQVLVLVASLCNFLAYGSTQRIAHHRGAGRWAEAAETSVQALWLGALLSLPLAAGLAAAARPIGAVLGAEGPTLDAATTYLRISALAVPAILLTIVCHGILRAEQRLRGLLVVVVVANVVNVVFEVVAVYVLDWGIAGSAWSTVAVQLGSVGVYVALVLPSLTAARRRRPDPGTLGALLSVGGPLVLRVVALMATFTIATAVAARTDPATLAAHQILASAFMLLALSLDALAIPAQSLVAEAMGRGDPDRARHLARRVTVLSLGCGGVLGLVVAASAPWSPRLFSGDQAVVSRASAGLVILAVLLLPGAVAFATDGILVGVGHFRVLGTMMMYVLAVFVPAISVPLLVPSTGIVGIWSALAVWMVARAVLGARATTRALVGPRAQ